MKLIDTPPVWLIAFVALAWAQARYVPTAFPHTLGDDVGALCVIAGLLVFVAAARQFRRERTTIVPRGEPRALLTTGVYGRSRNPIYLADALLLLGLSLWWGSALGVVLVAVFVVVMNRRFIDGEEAQLRATFGPAFESYAARVRRWL